MLIERVELCNFRNLKHQTLHFGERINFLLGRNAQGKTNIVEAVFIACTGHSFRTSNLKDAIRWNEDGAWIKALMRGNKGKDECLSKISLTGIEHYKNSKKIRSGHVGAVVFAPEEIVLLKDSPSARRRYFDVLFTQLDPEYGPMNKKYERLVVQRNRLLKNSGRDSSIHALLEPWDAQLAVTGARLIVKRAFWCERMNIYLPTAYRAISPSEKARLDYRPHTGEAHVASELNVLIGDMEEGFKKRRQDEIDRGMTLVGPHRDDFDAVVNNVPLKKFGSQGQHRTFVLGLKGAEMQLLESATSLEPILILDDVLSELDEERRKFLLKKIEETRSQVFITSTGELELETSSGGSLQKFTIDEGQLKSII